MQNKLLTLVAAILSTALIALLLFLLVTVVQGGGRPRYSLSLPRAPFITLDSDNLPETIEAICWNEKEGYCDKFQDPYLLYTVQDWSDETIGGLWQSGDRCYIQMFYAQAEHPYVSNWVVCP